MIGGAARAQPAPVQEAPTPQVRTELDSAGWEKDYASLNDSYMSLWQAPYIRFEDELLAQGDAAVVSWVDGRFALPAYMLRFEESRNPEHLDHFVARVRQLLTYRRDLDGDGLAGWISARYTTNLIRNGDFRADAAEWTGIDDSNISRLSAPATVLPFPDHGSGCRDYLPAMKLGRKYATIGQGTALVQAVTAPENASFYRFTLASQLDRSSQLELSIYSSKGSVAQIQIMPSPLAGPEGWQWDTFDLTLEPMTTYTVSLRAGEVDAAVPIRVDNLALTPYREEFTADFHMAAAMMQFASLAKRLTLDEPYQNEAQSYAAFAKGVVSKWQHRWVQLDVQRGAYMNSGVPSSNLPYNQMAGAGETLLLLGLYMEEGEGAAFRTQALMLGRTFQAALYPSVRVPGALLWHYRDPLIPEVPKYQTKPEDLGHAGHVVPFVRLLFENGLLFTADDLQRIESALLGSWNQDESAPLYLLLLDGESPFIRPYQMPYLRHLELTYSPALLHAGAVSWQARKTVGCQQEAQMVTTGRLMYLPAVALRILHNRLFFPVVATGGELVGGAPRGQNKR
jgi:hypothetical protein